MTADSYEQLTKRTQIALPSEVMRKIQDSQFCIMGCGAVGSLFAEMLVRTGAKQLSLVDGGTIEELNLNRGFFLPDVNNHKTCAVKRHLMNINDQVKINTIQQHLGPGSGNDMKNTIKYSNYVIIGMDDNHARIMCEKIIKASPDIDYLSIGVGIDPSDQTCEYECVWKPETPLGKADRKGYGDDNGSFASIIIEATAVGFNLMLHHMQNPKTDINRIYRKFKDFNCVENCVEKGRK